MKIRESIQAVRESAWLRATSNATRAGINAGWSFGKAIVNMLRAGGNALRAGGNVASAAGSVVVLAVEGNTTTAGLTNTQHIANDLRVAGCALVAAEQRLESAAHDTVNTLCHGATAVKETVKAFGWAYHAAATNELYTAYGHAVDFEESVDEEEDCVVINTAAPAA